MKIFKISLILLSLWLSSCSQKTDFDDTPEGNFEALWQLMDEHYCYFDYKAEEYGLDWNNVYYKYSKRISPNTSDAGLFEILCEMLAELRDGHVNLYNSSDAGRYWHWYSDYPSNFSSDIQKNYLNFDYRISGGLKYQLLDDNIGYLFIESFESSIGESGLDALFDYFSLCNGLIIDVRDNGGGSVEIAQQVASRFTNEKVFVGYIMHKTGTGHSQFSSPSERFIEPKGSRLRWQKSAVVLTNRSCYSATNTFVSDMKELPKVVVLGDSTGGGGGMPMSSELPNGWSVRYSAAPMLDVNGNHIEFGVAPDVKVDMTEEDKLRGIDTIIEEARKLINSQLK